MNENYLKITYSGFYDVPLAFVVNYNDISYLFWRGYFDDKIDGYSENYCVYRITAEGKSELLKNWTLDSIERQEVGLVPVADVVFDPTMRRTISTSIFKILGL